MIELQPQDRHCWRLVLDVEAAVDDILEGRPYKTQVRRRDPHTGEITVELSRCWPSR